MSNFKYALDGPPFNFLGTFTTTQKQSLEAWVNGRIENFSSIELFYRIRAQQLRKTAGLLENYYLNNDPDKLKPSFQKASWEMGSQGHFVPAPRFDHVPMGVVSDIKKKMQPQFEHNDDAVFLMNHLRTLIERNEDEAQSASESKTAVQDDIAKIESLFTQPQYQAILVDNVNASNMYKGQPYFRVNALDTPTVWELEQHSHSSDGTIQLKFPNTEVGQ